MHAQFAAPTRAECARSSASGRVSRAKRMPQCAWSVTERTFVSFFDFPEEHWVHVRTTNPIESIFTGVRLRTNAVKRMRVRENAL